jgi:KaiC/GvpD/RAD55 family RecA-like ATPase
VIQFPETAQSEWKIVADAANVEAKLRKQIERDTRVEGELEKLRIKHQATLMFQQELEADQTPTLEMMTLTEYKSDPGNAPADCIDGVLKEEGLCVVQGAPSSGKSTQALQMCYSLATGEPWLGSNVTKIDGGIGLMSYDMDASMLLDWMGGFPHFDTDKVSAVNCYKQGNPLGVPDFRNMIAERWKAMNVQVVVIDSFSASFFGHDENDAAATMAHYRNLKKFALAEVGAKVLIVIAHTGKAGDAAVRGSSVHQATADTIVSVEVDDKTQSRTVRVKKYRAARGQHMKDPVIIKPPDDVTHLCQLDTGAMTLAGMKLPANGVGAEVMFPELPEPHDEPDTAHDEEDDDL